MIPEFILNLASEIRELINQIPEKFFANCKASELTDSLVEEMKSHVITNMKAANDRKSSKSTFIELLIIDLISNFIEAPLNEEDLQTLVHFIGN